MISMKQVMAIARAETRLTRRLARYWIFMIISYLLVFIAWLQYSYYHGFASSYSASIAMLSPRLLVSVYGIYYLVIYIVGTIFLAFDIRARDQRERMIEVLDSRPYTNLELVAGRFLGILIPSWIPMLVLAILMELVGLLLLTLGAPMGEPVEPFSLFTCVILMGIPAVSFALALVFLLTLLVRNRLVAAVLLLILLGADYWALYQLPLRFGRIFDFFGLMYLVFPSDIIPSIMVMAGIAQRIGVLLAALGLLGVGAAVHPRLDGTARMKSALSSLLVIILGLVIHGLCYYWYTAVDFRKPAMWKAAHAARAEDPVPDIQTISGNVKIVPGKVLDLEIDLTFRAPGNESMERALFTLNPGQEVKSAMDGSGHKLDFTHENGLLEFILPQPLGPGDEARIHLSLGGVPDMRFGYLETAINFYDKKTSEVSNLGLLGNERGIFDSRFVALMPGLRWLPASGSETGRDDPRKRPVDFFTVDLFVDISHDWLVAGPGRRLHAKGENGSTKFRFAPPAFVPEVALIASRFESRSVEVEGVLMELLIHKKHTKNLDIMAETGELVKNWIKGRLKDAKEYGLTYPYDGLTLVEVPSKLQAYAGGWRMDTAMAPPGMILMRENGFPTARFDSAFRKPEQFKDKEGGLAQAKFDRLKTFFLNDFSGGNAFAGASRNFFEYQTAAYGPEGLALNYVMETLSTLLVTETKGYFSAHLFATGNRINQIINAIAVNYFTTRGIGATLADSVIDFSTSRPEVWDQALEMSLDNMDPWEDPARTLDVLTLKALALSQAILDTLGPEKTGELLASIRDDHRGESFSLKDVIEAGSALGFQLEELLGDMLTQTALPGFVCSKAEVYRIPDAPDGSIRYQLLFTVRNDEPVPGGFRFVYFYSGEDGKSELETSEPIRLAGERAVRFGTVLSRVPNMVFIKPYLALNRTVFRIYTKSSEVEGIEKVEAVVGLEEVPWTLPEEESIVVDDLDPGFSVEGGEETRGLRIGARQGTPEATDQGLPVMVPPRIPRSWSRNVNNSSWGKYRHTMVVTRPGNGDKKAVFTTTLPHSGLWDLEFFIPPDGFQVRTRGALSLVVIDANRDSHEIEFDSKSAPGGWNLVDTLDLPEGEIRVMLSDKTNGRIVIADAIRWSPSAGK